MSHPRDLFARDAGVAGQHCVLGPLVRGLAQEGHPQHEQFALARRQCRGEEDVARERVKGARQRRVLGQRAEGVESLGAILVLSREG